MSRSGDILKWVQEVDEADAVAFTLDHDPNFHLSNSQAYTYQDRGKKDDQGNTAQLDGTKPSGMEVTNDPGVQGRWNKQMSAQDQQMMDTRP